MPDLSPGVSVTVTAPTFPRVQVAPPPTSTVHVFPIVGPRGPAGVSGGIAVEHVQTEPAATWTVPLVGFDRLPSVAVYVGGAMVDTDVEVSASAAVLTFAEPTAGTVVLT